MAAQPTPPEIAYVVPRLSVADDSHFAHLPALLEAVGRRCKLTVVAERAEVGSRALRHAAVVVQRHADRFRPIRSVELMLIARRLRQQGCRRFFVRISVTAALTLALIARPLGIEVYYWTSGDPIRILPSWSRHPVGRLLGELRLLPYRVTLRLVTRVVTGPERMLRYYQSAFGVRPERCVLLYNDIDVARFRTGSADVAAVRSRFGLPTDGPMLLFVHRVSRRKGCFEIVPIMQQLPETVNCLIVGDGPHRGEVVRQVAAGGFDRRVRLAGAMPNPELPAIYRSADIAVVPSLEEGFPRVVLEAMASGLPVVAYDVGGVRDLLGPRQQAFVVEPEDRGAFASCVRRLLDDRSLARSLARENLDHVDRFDTARVADMFVERVVQP